MFEKKKNILLITLLLLLPLVSKGQFYYGLQMDFGKNRLQHYDFFWSFYRFEKFDTYYTEYGREIAEYTGNYAFQVITDLEDYFDYSLDSRIIFIIYNKQSDFKQSNIGLVSGNEEFNVGGITRMLQNKVFLFFEGDYRKLEQQITAAIAESIINEMLYGGVMKNRVTSSTRINLPDWYLKGLISYLSSDYDFYIENRIIDGFQRKAFKNLNHVEKEEAVYAGHSFWRFIAQQYGKSLIPHIIYLTKVNKNVNKGFLFVLGSKMRALNREWVEYYNGYYEDQLFFSEVPAGREIIKKPKNLRAYQQLKISPDGRNFAYVSNEYGQIKLWIYNSQTGKKKRVFRKFPKIEQILDYSYPIIEWHPNGRLLTFIMEEKGGLTLNYYLLETGKIEKRNLLYFDKVLDFSYSIDGSQLVLSAVKQGFTDLFIHTIASGTNEQLTQDIADDLHPRFIDGSRRIIFSSNRKSDTLVFSKEVLKQTQNTFDLFIYDRRNNPDILTRLEGEEYSDKVEPYEMAGKEYLSLDNTSGIYNRYRNDFDSIISYVDTIIHYRFLANSSPLTNYNRSILDHDYDPVSRKVGDVIYYKGRHRIYENNLDDLLEANVREPAETDLKQRYDRHLMETDSINRFKNWVLSEHRKYLRELEATQESERSEQRQPVLINNYTFESEKSYYYSRYIRNSAPGLRIDTITFRLPKIRIYETYFYNNYFASKADFSFLGASYQAFSGSGAAFYNPGLNALFKIGTQDLFEDFKITGGFRFSGNFDSNEYLLSFENLKGKFDKQLLLHRLTFTSSLEDDLVKSYTHEAMYSMKFPFSQASSLKGSVTIRDDNFVYLSTDVANLNRNSLERLWGSLKLEWIFDNTRFRTINIYNGTRFKIFGEMYYQLNRRKSDVFVLGADFRHYLKIHRDLIWANRFAASTSFGRNRLIYYLGGVDNWINIFPGRVEQFDQSVAIDYSKNYVFQTLATNMRGFTQNIRNGNNFALINSEIRWPIIRYLVNHPLGSDFLNSLQLVAFGDIGTAWTGLTPYSGENTYDKEVIENGPLTITIDTGNEPIVAGFGLGARVQLFGYYIRADYAWGIETNTLLDPIFYLSFSMDF